MRLALDALRRWLISLAGHLNQQQQEIIDTSRKRAEFFGNNSAIDGCAARPRAIPAAAWKRLRRLIVFITRMVAHDGGARRRGLVT